MFGTGADWGQKASAAISFIKATETLWKKPHVTLKKARTPLKMYLKIFGILGKASISLKKYLKIIEIFIKALHF
jgi:hypothetical protein